MSKLNTLLNIQQSLTAEQIRKQNEVLINTSIDNNVEIKKLYKQLNETNAVNREILKNQIKEAKQIEEQKFYKAFVFKISEIVDSITEIKDPILKYHFNSIALNGTSDEIDNVIEKLDEISDKQSAREIYKKVEKLSKELMPLSEVYNNSKFPKLTSLSDDYKALEASLRQKPNFQSNGREIKKGKITFWLIFHSVGTIASFMLALNSHVILLYIFSFWFGSGVIREIKQFGMANTYLKDLDLYTVAMADFEKRNKKIDDLLKNHEIHSYIETLNREYPDYSYYAKELEKIEMKFYKKWDN